MFNIFKRKEELLRGSKGSYVIVDLETTGKNAGLESPDQIVEIALIEVDSCCEELYRWETTVKAGKASAPMAIQKHRLSKNMLANSPSFSDIGYWLASYLDGKMLVGHNLLNFDAKILAAEFSRLDGLEVEVGQGVDTLPTPSKGYGLDNLRDIHSIAIPAHEAMGDARTVLELIKKKILIPDPGESVFRIIQTPYTSPQLPIIADRASIHRLSASRISSLASNEAHDYSMVPGPSITLRLGDKVCLSGGAGDLRSLMEEKHRELGLLNPRNMSKTHVAIVVDDLHSSAAKPVTARKQGAPFILAKDFIENPCGSPIATWSCSHKNSTEC
jgi:DNA polymerase III epsilon subunit-like protein